MHSSVTFSNHPTADDWERMKREVTDIWLHQAGNNRDTVSILSSRYKYRMMWMETTDLYHAVWSYVDEIEFTERIQKAHSALRDMARIMFGSCVHET